MKIAIIGYGKMGHAIERIALERGHQIVSVIDADNTAEFDSDAFASADAAIEFTTPSTAPVNIARSAERGVPVVCGSTGWADRRAEVEEAVLNAGSA
ncbi:MAG: NAD(P)-binding domain-containing protein, partial [Duncaniella sp.]|nr:NAD(P)-binding domain-containing protein [Duncaniella sp.]